MIVYFIWCAIGFVIGVCVCAAPLLADHKACREDDVQDDDWGIGA